MVHKNVRIIIGDVYDDAARAVMCTAYHLSMTANDSYVWFLPAWLSLDWYDTDKYNKKNNESVECTTEEMIKVSRHASNNNVRVMNIFDYGFFMFSESNGRYWSLKTVQLIVGL